LSAFEHGLLLLVIASKLIVGEVAIATLVLCALFDLVLAVKDVDVGL
jgi:hypothetical protein